MSEQAFSAFPFWGSAAGKLFDIDWHSATVEELVCITELVNSPATRSD